MSATFKSILWLVVLMCASTPAMADWRAATPAVQDATTDPRIAGALSAVDAIDKAAMSDDPSAFAAFLAGDLAVNNPQNGVSVRGATAQRSAAGKISYSRYDRVIEYAGLRGDMVLLMGEEIVLPKGSETERPREMHRRFTDLWKLEGGRWKLSARQATIIERP
jgi:hypothetical protein